MPSYDMSRLLTPELICQLLDKDARAGLSTDYVRLMEIYCVVKAGGVNAQVSAARHLEEAERAAMLIEITELSKQTDQASRIESLRQEMAEVERSATHRIAHLSAIDPQEEANVRSCLPLIDVYFANLRKTETL